MSKAISSTVYPALPRQPLPFGDQEWLNHIFGKLEEIHNFKGYSLIDKVQKLFYNDHHFKLQRKNPIDGSDLVGAHPTKMAFALIDKLAKSPTCPLFRFKLVSHILFASRKYDTATYQRLLIHSMLTLYLGELSPASIQLMIHAYIRYLEQLCNLYSKEYSIESLGVRSEQLKHSDLNWLNVVLTENNKKLSAFEVSIQFGIQLKNASHLLSQARNAKKMIETLLQAPLRIEELDQLLFEQKTDDPHQSTIKEKKTSKSWDFTSSPSSGKKQTINRKQVLKNAFIVIDITKWIPLLHPLGLKLLEKLKLIEPRLNLVYVMEARIYMKAVEHYIIRVETGDSSCTPNITPTFNKAVVAYRKALKRTSVSHPSKQDLPVFVEIAQIARYARVRRSSMKLSKEGVIDLLKEGKKAADIAVQLDDRYLDLQMKVLKDLIDLSGKEQSG